MRAERLGSAVSRRPDDRRELAECPVGQAIDGPRKGSGAFCRITYVLDDVVLRKDCIADPTLDCTDGWAFDLEISDAEVDAAYADCDAILCGALVTGLDGEAITYAYGLFLDTALVLGTWSATGWTSLLTHPDWEPGTGALSYEYESASRVPYCK